MNSSDEYYAAVKRLGLRKTTALRLYFHPATGEYCTVPDPSDMTPEQRARTIERLKNQLGIDTSH
jgi:hypothetical protein